MVGTLFEAPSRLNYSYMFPRSVDMRRREPWPTFAEKPNPFAEGKIAEPGRDFATVIVADPSKRKHVKAEQF
jgi:hypothetical protein